MFTGIIESLGKVESLQSVGGDVRLRIQTDLDMSDVHLGDSIATNGICLTVIEWGDNWYAADVSRESLNRTTLGNWKVGQRVNVEKAMLPTTRFGGHIVSGHVDGVGEITVVREDARSIYYEVTAPTELAKYLARHGINVVLDEVDAAGRDIATVFESHLTLRDADLLVMGAYGHSRFREFVLGGATRSILVRPPVPVFLSH